MSFSEERITYIENIIKKSLRDKFLNYKPETHHMPFHYRLLGEDRMALFSFIHSLNTTFGTSIFEPVAVGLAKLKFKNAKRQVIAGANGSLEFSVSEFTGKYSLDDLCSALRRDGLIVPSNTVDALNELLLLPDLYDKLINLKKNKKIPTNIMKLKESYDESKDESDLKSLNRLLLRKIYPKKAPKLPPSKISEEAHKTIQKIMDSLVTGQKNPDKQKEIESIRAVCQQGAVNNVKPTVVDVFVEDNDGSLFLFDIKTVKPNIGNFKEFKRTLLEWVATTLFQNPAAKINTIIAIPYNPYAPKPYERWTMRGMLDLNFELKVADEFWDFLGGQGAYHMLLDCFEKVGIELRPEIDEYFAKFSQK